MPTTTTDVYDDTPCDDSTSIVPVLLATGSAVLLGYFMGRTSYGRDLAAALRRIEPRKASLNISRLAERARRHVVFVGLPLHGDSAFARAFHAAVQRSQYSKWIAGVPRSMLAAFYRHSSFLLNASFVEVSPLVDVEALSQGCPVSTTMYALHHQLLPPDTPLCDPYDDRSILDRLQWRPSRLPPRQLVDREMCGRRLVDTYLALAHAGDGSGEHSSSVSAASNTAG